jgi:hypothetical protein
MELAMHPSQPKIAPAKLPRSPGMRLVRIIVVETLAVAIVGGLVWGVAWDLGFPTAGMVAAIAIWLTVSPIIEIATVMKYRHPGAAEMRGDSSR